MPCGHVVGVAGFQLVVQALHQLILCSGCDWRNTHFRSYGEGESRPPRCLGPAGCSSAEAGGSGVLSCGSLPGGLGLGQSHRVQAPGEGAQRVIGLRLDSEARLRGGAAACGAA